MSTRLREVVAPDEAGMDQLMHGTDVTVEARGKDQWRVQVTRRHGDHSATGEVDVKGADKPSSENAPHLALAESRAWFSLGEKLLETGDAQAAVECARKGLDALGTSYRSPAMVDDTSMKLYAAEDRIEQGHVADGAKVMLTMLQNRTAMYVQKHKDELVDL